MIWIIASIIGYAAVLMIFRGKPVTQEMLMLCIFLIALTFVGTLDILLPVYSVAVFLPLLKGIRKFRVLTILLFFYYFSYVLYGFVFQSISTTCVSLLSKFYQFLIFFVVMNSSLSFDEKDEKNKKDFIPLFVVFLLVESLLGIWLYFHGYSHQGPQEGIRLVANSQPITGNLAIAALPLLATYYFSHRKNKRAGLITIFFIAAFLMWCVVSGTRGYVLLFGLTILPILMDYFFIEGRKYGERFGFLLVILSLGTIIFLLSKSFFFDAEGTLRLKDSLGIRTYENALVHNFMHHASPLTKLFGIGFGGTAGTYPQFLTELGQQIAHGMWDADRYRYASGPIFHNFFTNVLMIQGFVGVLVVILMFFYILFLVWQTLREKKGLRITMVIYWIGFLLMIYYRWSADCGIGEMILFSMMLKREGRCNT